MKYEFSCTTYFFSITFDTLAKDMGSGQVCYIGKSFYPDDVNFSGEIDNLSVYRTALSPAEVQLLSGTPGDVNGDGKVNLADIVTLQRFLLGSGSLKNAGNADICSDGHIDAFDLTVLRQMLIEK